MASGSVLLWGVIFGSIGIGFFTYGKKQKKAVPLFTGIVLIMLPYLIFNAAVLVMVGLVVAAVPFFVKI